MVSKLLNVALNKSAKMSVHYMLGTIIDWQAAGKPAWLISEINSNFFKNNTIEQVWKESSPDLIKTPEQMGFEAYLKPTEFPWALESSHYASLSKLLLQTLYSASTFPSWGTWALCHKDAENAETCQLPSYVSCSKLKKLKLSKHLTPSIHLYSHVKQ